MQPVRRSWLVVPVADDALLAEAAVAGADVVVLDLMELLAKEAKPAARECVRDALGVVAKNGAQVFVQIDLELMYADLEACVWPGLAGVVLPRLESVSQVDEATSLMKELEQKRGLLPNSLQVLASVETARGNQAAFELVEATPRIWGLTLGRADLVMDLRPEPSGEIHLMQYLMQRAITVANASGKEARRGLDPGSLQIIVLIESALGVWNVREIVTASPRITQVGLEEGELGSRLGIFPQDEYDPFAYAQGRLVIEATAAGVQPLGIGHPLALLPQVLPAEELVQHGTNARSLGFKGIICPHSSWVGPVNHAFTPATELVDHYRQVREVYAQGVAAGTAAVPFQGRMIDVPVDERAKVVLRQAELCAKRDEEKRQAPETGLL